MQGHRKIYTRPNGALISCVTLQHFDPVVVAEIGADILDCMKLGALRHAAVNGESVVDNSDKDIKALLTKVDEHRLPQFEIIRAAHPSASASHPSNYLVGDIRFLQRKYRGDIDPCRFPYAIDLFQQPETVAFMQRGFRILGAQIEFGFYQACLEYQGFRAPDIFNELMPPWTSLLEYTTL